MSSHNSNGSAKAPVGIAIIGLGGCFPDANTVAAYWDNICRNHVAIGPVPADRWRSDLYYSADRSVPDKTYSRIGGFVQPAKFDARRFRIPPRTLEAIDEVQKMALTAVAEALEDANLAVFAGGPGRPFNRDQTAVILGNAMGGEAEDRTNMRVWFAEMRETIEKNPAMLNLSDADQAQFLERLEAAYKAKLSPVTEDSMPGELSNCITGRIANAFDMRGPNFTTDAACAASIAALQTAMNGLQRGEFDMAVVGGADRSMDPPAYVKFSKIGALSAELSAPFDSRASGFVMGEGVGIMILKRVDEALRDGDKIYAVILGVGGASDGRGKGITAPNPRGQRMALERAYKVAQIPISSIGLFELHGTSTTVGDATELQVLNDLLREVNAPKTGVPIGSVKSMIGHLKSASGAAAVIKAALALHHKILPPSANFISAPPESPLHEGYLRVNTQTRPWETPAGGIPRRVGVSSFGFGGTNFHLILQEAPERVAAHGSVQERASAPSQVAAPAQAGAARQDDGRSRSPRPAAAQVAHDIVAVFAEKTGYAIADLELNHQLEADLGVDTVKQAEIFGIIRQRYQLPSDETFRLASTPTLQSIIDYVLGRCAAPQVEPHEPSPPMVRAPASGAPQVLRFAAATAAEVVATAQKALQNAASLADVAQKQQALTSPARLAFAAKDLDEARQKASDAGKRRAKMLAAQGIFLAEGAALAGPGKMAFLFPGQGSQYLGMMRDLADVYPVVAEVFEQANRTLEPLVGSRLTDIVWAQDADEASDLRLRETQNCQPAMLTADVAMLRLLEQFGVRPDRVAGHSLGEYAAAVAAKVMTFDEALYAVSARGREMAGVRVEDNGKMAMVAADAARVQAVLDTIDGYVIAANKNCHTQTVIAGASAVVDEVIALFAQQNIEARHIPVSHAFHCSIVAPAAEPLSRVLRSLDLKAPTTPIVSNVGATYYPTDKAGIVALMAKQLASPVEFIAQLNTLYADGVRLFVEVGPRRALTGFVRNVMGTREHRAFASNHPKKPGIDSLMELLAALVSEGVPVQFAAGPHSTSSSWSAAAAAARPPDAPAAAASTKSQSLHHGADDAVVISGMGIALPGDQPFCPVGQDPWRRLLVGENFIKEVPVSERQDILDRNVVRLNKAGGEFTPLRHLGEVVQLVARFGHWDIQEALGLEQPLADALDSTSKLALMVGVDALRDAGLPLIRRYRTTSTGTRLADRWALPAELAPRTGVILASAFPGIDPILDEAARYAAAQGARRSASELEGFVEGWAAALPDAAEASRLRQAYQARAKALRDEAELYQFNRKWLFRALSLGHAQLAQMILAQGPNTQINAACASGPQALGVACDWIKQDRCDRVVVVTADDVTHPHSLAWFGAGFLAAGAASVEPDVSRAAVPFGAKRNGMILGSGASGFVVERRVHVAARGMVAIAELLLARFSNSGYHGTRLDNGFICNFLDAGLDEVQALTGYTRDQLAERAFFMSHETYTPARGGSSAAEVDALRHGFGAAAAKLLVANTKGYTGHPMGASLEDAVAIKGLQRQELPAVANMHEVDPTFADLRFAQGGPIAADVALRFGAGFGSQVALTVYGREATQEARVQDPQRLQAWLDKHAGRAGAGLEIVARTLRVAETGGVAPWLLGEPSLRTMQPKVGAESVSMSRPVLLKELAAIFAQQTGYDVGDFLPHHNLEADLGIDTVKQAEIFAILRDSYGIPRELSFKLSDFQTLQQITDYVLSHQPSAAPSTAPVATTPRSPAESAPGISPSPLDHATLLGEITELFAQHTGYDAADFEPNHGLEADLGVDTVKQAEIFGILRQRYGMPQDPAFKLADLQTLNAVVNYVLTQTASKAPPGKPAGAASPHPSPPPEPHTRTRTPAPAPAPATPAGGANLTRDELIAQLRALFAEHTGYDLADLDPSHGLEADLGVDTVKQAEIFSVLRERYALVRDEQFRLSDVQTIAAIADYVLANRLQEESPTPAIAAAAAPLPPQAPQTDDKTAELVALFAQHTGYDLADLDPQHALEADLGIDTVKQAEIFGIIRGRYGLSQDDSFKLTDVPNIAAIADYVRRRMTASATAPQGAAPAALAKRLDAVIDARFAVRPVGLVPVAPTAQEVLSLRSKRVVLAGSGPLLGALRARLIARGAQVHILADAAGSRAQLDERLAHMGGAPADAVVFVCDVTAADATGLHDRLQDLFALAGALRRARKTMMGAGLLVVGHGGNFGFASPPGNALSLSTLSGCVKTLAKEWLEARCAVVDMDPEVECTQAAELALQAWVNLGPVELVWSRNAWWSPRRLEAVDLPVAEPLAPNSVVLATGGARGVTYELLRALAQQTPLRIIVVARTDGATVADSPLTGRTGPEQKELARAALAVVGERSTPAAVRRWIEREEVRLQVAANLQALRELGCEVTLFSCDVANATALATVLQTIRQRFGRPALVLHGAGVEESRFLADKDAASLTRVFAPKAAALTIHSALEPLRMVTMGSVAGRFGNAGQADYAAANELMAALARTTPGVLNIGWTAWSDVGMATRGSVRHVLEGLGVELLPASSGVALGARLIASNLCGDVVAAGALGSFDDSEKVGVVARHPLPLPPLFHRYEQRDGCQVLFRRLNPQRDAGLDHHRIDSVPVLPGVMGVELMVQAASYVRQRTVRHLTDIQFTTPLKLFYDRALEAAVEVMEDGSDLRLLLVSQFQGPSGQTSRRVHFTARALGASVPCPAPLAAPVTYGRDPMISRQAIYQRYFHGPVFQVLEKIVELGDNGIDGTAVAERPVWLADLTHDTFTTAPLLREAGFQLAGLWEMVRQGRMSLPASIDSLWLAPDTAAVSHADLMIRARCTAVDNGGCTFEVQTCDGQGRLLDVMCGYKTAVMRKLHGRERFEISAAAAQPSSLVVSLDEVQRLLQEDVEAALRHYLSPAERARYETLVVHKRKLEWLAVRIAAKRLIAERCSPHDGQEPLAYSSITIHRDALGAPEVEITGISSVPRISMSHSDGIAAAFLSPQADVRPGIDVERVEERDPSFAETYFAESERAQAHRAPEYHRALTEIWAVKEATLKALGVGARVDFRDVLVSHGSAGWHVVLRGEALAKAKELSTDSPEVHVEVEGSRVIARVLLPVRVGATPEFSEEEVSA